MKKVFLFIIVAFSFQAFANPYSKLDQALEMALKSEKRNGISSKGKRCEVRKSGANVMVIDKSVGCTGPENTINIECLSQFLYNQSAENMSIKELEISQNQIIAEIKSKDTEEYTSAVTGKIEVEIGNKTFVRVSSKKKLLGGYKRVLDCII